MVFLILCWLIFVAVWLYTLVNILKNDFTGNNKVIWLILVVFLAPIGIVLYFLIGRNQRVFESTTENDEQPEFERTRSKWGQSKLF